MLTAFLYLLTGGVLAVLATGRPDQIAWRFIRLIGAIVLAISCGVVVWHAKGRGLIPSSGTDWPTWIGTAPAVAAAVIVFIAPIAAREYRIFRTLCAVGGLLGVVAGGMATAGMLGESNNTTIALVMVVISTGLAAALLGSVTVAWLLGHAYLTAPNMTIAPLRHFTRMLSWAVALRIAFVAVSLALAKIVGGGADPAILSRLAGQGLILAIRGGVGLVAVAVFTYMVADCVRLRSTQSATGILYFGSLFVYMGELAGLWLIFVCGWPL